MKMKCLYRTILRGDVVKVGEVLDLTAAECEMDVVKQFFVKVADAGEGGTAAPAQVSTPSKAGATSATTTASAATSARAGLIAGLTREQALMKLTQAGVSVRRAMPMKALEELYNQTFANVAEAAESAE